MATFSTNNIVDFNNGLSVLANLDDPATFSNKTANGFTSTSSDVFPHVIEVIGTNFDYLLLTGTINSLVIKPPFFGTAYTITGLSLSYSALHSALYTSTETALAKIFENADLISGSGFDDLMAGHSGNDEIHGGSGNDELFGGLNDDHLFGGADNDQLFGASHKDHLFGGDGNDMLSGGSGDDELDGGAGIDRADYVDKVVPISVTLSGGVDATVLVNGIAEDTVRNIENVVGGAGNDLLTGDKLANALSGAAGDDTLDGAGGDDLLFGDSGNDNQNGAAGNDELYGGSGNDTQNGAAGSDILYGGSGNDNINGEEGDDTLSGGLGADVMDGGAGIDTANYFVPLGAVGDISVTLNGANATVLSINGVAEDTLLNIENVAGDSGNDALTGDDLANVFTGNLGNDSLFGMKGDDTLDGGEGADTLSGGKGMDMLFGGAAADSFVFDAKPSKKKNVDTVDDFVVVDDTIHLADKGKLYYDADGKKDGFDKVLVAKLDTGLAMTHEDFFVV